ncbi:transmembrane adaptor Erv26-domain-containing protein [Pholiota molesta]|nr:transmembrane adaptor Erv26-domain-containing protein [Pholiota molesta]
MGLLYYVSYAAIVAAFCFVTLSLASGLLYVSELIEEHSRLAKLVGQRSIYVIMALHIVFYFTDSLPLIQTLFSLTCHVIYLQNFSSTWPLISLTSPSFLASCALVIADHFLWFFYFARITGETRRIRSYRGAPAPQILGFAEIASFFAICVCLSANDNALPTTTTEPMSPTITQTSRPSRVSLIRSIFGLLSLDSALPRFRSQRRDSTEGLLAPRSPNPPRTPVPNIHNPLPTSPALRPSMYPPPPRSPGPRIQEIDLVPIGNSSNFKLNAPPRRGPTPPTRSDSLGLGISLRRTVSYVAEEK